MSNKAKVFVAGYWFIEHNDEGPDAKLFSVLAVDTDRKAVEEYAAGITYPTVSVTVHQKTVEAVYAPADFYELDSDDRKLCFEYMPRGAQNSKWYDRDE